MAETHTHAHEHIRFEPASLVAARLCPACGSYVSSLHLNQHQELHDQLLELASNGKNASEAQGELF